MYDVRIAFKMIADNDHVLGDDKKQTRLKWKELEIPVKLSKKDNQGYEVTSLELIGKGE